MHDVVYTRRHSSAHLLSLSLSLSLSLPVSVSTSASFSLSRSSCHSHSPSRLVRRSNPSMENRNYIYYDDRPLGGITFVTTWPRALGPGGDDDVSEWVARVIAARRLIAASIGSLSSRILVISITTSITMPSTSRFIEPSIESPDKLC